MTGPGSHSQDVVGLGLETEPYSQGLGPIVLPEGHQGHESRGVCRRDVGPGPGVGRPLARLGLAPGWEGAHNGHPGKVKRPACGTPLGVNVAHAGHP